MFRRLISTLVAGVGLSGPAIAQQRFVIGSSDIVAPAGWIQISKTEDRLVLRSPDGRQQATLSVLLLAADATLDDFKRLCGHRIEAEKKDLGDGFIEPEVPSPFRDRDTFGMFYSGGDKKSHIFSAYLSLAQREFLTIYVEGIGVAAKDHLDIFKAFVTELKRK